MATIPVSDPCIWWRGPSSEIQKLVTVDPDIEDCRKPRWNDTYLQRWTLIAETVSTVGDHISRHEWSADEESGYGFVTLPPKFDVLSNTELKIVRAWFSKPEAVTFDPWDTHVTDGRHRLWSTLNLFGDGRVPIRGGSLLFANDADSTGRLQVWKEAYASDLSSLSLIPWFDFADSLNHRFLVSLQGAVSGIWPSS